MREAKGELVTAKVNPDSVSWVVKVLDQLEKKYPGYTIAESELVEGETQPDSSVIAHYKAKIVPKGK
jgi:hypothetical protein